MDDVIVVADDPAALQSVAAPPPALDAVLVSEVLAQEFGLRGELDPLVSERDQNFRLRTPNGSQFVVKVVSSVEDPGVTDFQIAALQYLEAQGATGVPRIVRNLSDGALGSIRSQGADFRLRVTSWLQGEPLVDRGRDWRCARTARPGAVSVYPPCGKPGVAVGYATRGRTRGAD